VDGGIGASRDASRGTSPFAASALLLARVAIVAAFVLWPR
jgi:hypothetical protein